MFTIINSIFPRRKRINAKRLNTPLYPVYVFGTPTRSHINLQIFNIKFYLRKSKYPKKCLSFPQPNCRSSCHRNVYIRKMPYSEITCNLFVTVPPRQNRYSIVSPVVIIYQVAERANYPCILYTYLHISVFACQQTRFIHKVISLICWLMFCVRDNGKNHRIDAFRKI